jgi:hypothetical protein
LKGNVFVLRPRPDQFYVPSTDEFLKVLDKKYPTEAGKNSWHQLLTPSARLAHYWTSNKSLSNGVPPTDVPEGWTSGLAQYVFHIKNKLYFDHDDKLSMDYFGHLCHQIYSSGEKNSPPMTPFEYSFQIIADFHCESDAIHLSRDKTYDQVKKFSSTITKEVVACFIQCCPHPTCAGRRVRGTQHSADYAAAKKRKAESGPSTNGSPKRKRTRPQPQEQDQQQEQQPYFPNVQMGQLDDEEYQPKQHVNVPTLPSDIWSQLYDVQQRDEGYQPQQHQQPYFPNVPDAQNDINDDDFAAPQQSANVQMEQVDNGYPLQPSLIGQLGYEGYTESIHSQQQPANIQAGQNNNINPALSRHNSADDQNNTIIDPALTEHNSPDYQEQPQEAATTANIPVDQNDNGEEGFEFFDFDGAAEADPTPDFDYSAALDASNWQFD